jgi:iron(III) transport system permease protein
VEHRVKLRAVEHRVKPRGVRPRAETLLTGALLLLLGWLVIVPAASVLASGADLTALRRLLSGTSILTNTLLMGAATSLCAVIIGGALALMLVRTDLPGRATLEPLTLLPLYVTPLLTAIAWSWLGSPRGGLVNLVTQRLAGFSAIDLHGASGVVFVASLAYAPVPFLLIAAGLRAMDPSLEDSARVHGASLRFVFSRVTLPLMLPSALGALVLVFVQTMGLFSIPAVLGVPGGFTVIATEIYRLLNTYPPRLAQAAAWGLVLLLITLLAVLLQNRLLAKRSFVTITGKAFRPRLIAAGRVRWLLAAFVWLYIGLAVALPVATLIWASLVNFLTPDPALMAFDLRHFSYVLFTYPKALVAARNSLLLGVVTASLIVVLSLGAGWVAVRGRNPGATAVEYLAMAPLAIPSIVLALGVLWTYAGLDLLPIYGTIAILLVAYLAHFLPFGVRAVSGALQQLHPELEDAARVSGAGFVHTLRRVVFPLTRPTLAAVWTLVFVLALQEVSASILLYTSRSVVLSVAMFDLWEAGTLNGLAALGVMQLAITFAALSLLTPLRQRGVAA